jgi:uncharacterized protein YoxC
MAQDVNIKIKVDTSQANSSTDNYKKRLKELKYEMTALQVETDGLTKASAAQKKRFAELEKEAGKIADAMGDAAARVKNLSDDYKGMSAAMQGVGAGVGAFTAVSGAMSMLGQDSEKVNEAIKKMTSLLGILQGVMAVQKALNKDSQLMTLLRANSMKELNAATATNAVVTGEATVATETFTTAEKTATTASAGLSTGIKGVGAAIKSIPVVGWIAAIVSALLVAVNKIKTIRDEQKKAYEATAAQYKEFQDKINNTAAQTITKFELLSKKYNDLGDNIKAKEQFIKDHKASFDELGASINGVKEAEDFLINNKDAFIQSEIAKATAAASREKATDLIKQKLELQEIIETNKKLAETTKAIYEGQGVPAYEIEKTTNSYKKAIQETQAEIDVLDAQITKLFGDIQIETNSGGTLSEHKKEVKEVKEAYEDWDAVMEELAKSIPNLTEKEKKHQQQLEFWKPLISSTEELVGDALKKMDEEEEEYFKREEERLNRLQQLREAKWKAASLLVSTYSELVNASMEAELEEVGENEAEQQRIRKKYARSKFLAQIGSIGVSTAQAIMEAWSSVAAIMFPGNVIAGSTLTAMLAATGISQTMKARAEMDNALKAARGGILNGPSHAQGGIVLSNGVEAEGGEAIINKRSTAAFAPLLSEINSFNGYGAPLISSASASGGTMGAASDEMIRRIVAATVEGVTSIPVVVSEHAVTEAQRTVRLTKERSLI